MKFPSLSIAKRLMLTVTSVICIGGLGFMVVIHSLTKVESILESESTQYISLLTENSSITRQVFDLTVRVQLLEQAILYSESVLSKESLNIDLQLQQMRELTSNELFSQKIDSFIENFHRFLGTSFALNRIIKETKQLDNQIFNEINELDFLIADSNFIAPINNDSKNNGNVDIIHLLRETSLTVGKMVGSIRSRITPETERVVIIEAQKELDIFLLHLANIKDNTKVINNQKRKINRIINNLHTALRKMQANLEQRWIIMEALVQSQNELLSLVENTEENVQKSTRDMIDSLKADISQSRFEAVIIALLAILSGLFLISKVIKNHIRHPLNNLSQGFDELESSESFQRINLGRVDEWKNIASAFNKMANRLQETYTQLNKEKKNFDFLAHHDPLTGLANRLLITKKLQHLIKRSSRTNNSFILLYLDVDQFKTINDSLGHSVGDDLLTNIAQTLKEIIGDQGTVARMGGDEFMVLLSAVDNMLAGEVIANKINQQLRKPYFLEEKTIFVSSSIGLCKFPEHGKTDKTLVRNADTAMYKAKRSGRDQYCVYTDSMTLEANDLMEIGTGLRQALKNDEFEMVFQPQVDMRTGAIIGAEALIRWNHPTLGYLSPIYFLSVAEKSGLILEIDDWVFRKVISLIDKWKTQGVEVDTLLFSINFSARKFFSLNLVQQLEQVLKNTNCAPSQLTLEITEQQMMTGFEKSADTINLLRQKGFRIAIDDFGTGYSSLALLKNLPVDTVKLDRSFIIDIAKSKRDLAIVRSIMSLTKELNLDVVVEGIEDKSQMEHLLSLDCYNAQGYYFARPLNELQWLTFLETKSVK